MTSGSGTSVDETVDEEMPRSSTTSEKALDGKTLNGEIGGRSGRGIPDDEDAGVPGTGRRGARR